jgi:hypothetical protein
MISSSRRGFLRGLAGVSLLSAGGCCGFLGGKARKPCQKVRLAAVGIMGKGYSDWTPMLKTGLVEMVAFCDADATMHTAALEKAKKDLPDIDLSQVPFYTDYRKLLDDADKLGIDAMTISTPDHVHAPVAILAMKKGIHVYVQKPLVRTLWELDYFDRTARENGVVVQMGNQGSSLDSMRRCTEVLQSGILGDVREVHVWTNRPVWPQGEAVAKWVKGHPQGDPIRNGLDWNAWLATAAERPFLDKYPKDADVYDPWNIGKNVYHTFTWRGFFDFGCGAFGDMACHTMNLAFRGLELGGVSDAICTMIESANDVAYPLKSIVKLTYKERESKVRPGVKLPAVTLYWYDGNEKPSADLMPKWASKHGGKVPNTGCLMIGSKGQVLMQDDYGAKCAIALDADKEFADVFKHEAAKAVERSIPFCGQSSSAGDGKSTVEMKGFAEGHYGEFINAIFGNGPYYEQTHSRCFADIEYCIPQMEGILVGCVAQRMPNQKLYWSSKRQAFDRPDANAFIRPYIRKGFEF